MWRPLARVLNRREARARVAHEADTLLTLLGDMGYDGARSRGRACRAKGDRAGDRLWSRGAVEIARRIGETVADRYEAAAAERPADPRQAELRRAIQDIGRGLAELASGRGEATTLHNLEARVLNALELVGNDVEARAAGDALCFAAGELEAGRHENAAALASGVYPPRLEAASDALERFRAAALVN